MSRVTVVDRFEDPGRRERRNREEEGQLGGGDPIDAPGDTGRDGGAGSGDSGDQTETLHQPDDEAIAQSHRALASLLPRGRDLVVPALGPPHHRGPGDRRAGHHPETAQRPPDHVLECKADQAHGDRADEMTAQANW